MQSFIEAKSSLALVFSVHVMLQVRRPYCCDIYIVFSGWMRSGWLQQFFIEHHDGIANRKLSMYFRRCWELGRGSPVQIDGPTWNIALHFSSHFFWTSWWLTTLEPPIMLSSCHCSVSFINSLKYIIVISRTTENNMLPSNKDSPEIHTSDFWIAII